jgi:synaptobrevin family protein YKT6|mmetsp:Transcript_21083/g.45691  ORF Transcript_21083/g.45691 Transcript_21083/m.45691 type:complete len:205 (+) Transcript_21083:141-755(+)|eukprot:scaffold164_cov212-Alexandrium_tamarense.AAC.25
MKVVGITILRTGVTEDPEPLSMACDLSSYGFFQRQGVKEMLTFFSKTFTKRTEPGQRQSISHESYVVHCYVRSDGLAGCVTTDEEYPARVAFVLLTQLLDEFLSTHGSNTWKSQASLPSSTDSTSFPQLEEYLVKYQDPASADKVTKIQNDLDETTQILHKTIDSVLERGVKLDSLVEKSDDLSRQSKMFYKQAKKTNSCCVVS